MTEFGNHSVCKGYDGGLTKGKCEECAVAGSFRKPEDDLFYCKNHKVEGVMDQSKYYCVVETEGKRCTKVALYGFSDVKQKLTCRDHSGPEMINLTEKMCEKCGKTSPKWDFDDYTERPRYCKKCIVVIAADEKNPRSYSDKKSKKCKSCSQRATFGDATGYATWCSTHKTEGSVDVVHGRTHKPLCDLDHKPQPLCDPTPQTQAFPKGDYKEPGMCILPMCEETATYGPVFSTSVRCEKHHRHTDVDDDDDKLCSDPTCHTPATMAAAGDYKPTFCFLHSTDKYCIDLLAAMETSVGIWEPEPEDEICRPAKTTKQKVSRVKEKEVMNMIESIPDLEIISMDKRIKNGKTLYRPDCLIKCFNYRIVVEVDEHQHRGYKEKEIKRMIDITKDIGTDVLFIRYNPDNYIPSVSGAQMVPKKERLEILRDTLQLYNSTVRQLDRPLLAMYLFYDYWNGQPSVEIIGGDDLKVLTCSASL